MFAKKFPIGALLLSCLCVSCAAPEKDGATMPENHGGGPEAAMESGNASADEAQREANTLAERMELRRQFAEQTENKARVLEKMPTDDKPITAAGEVPDEMLQAIIDDLVARTGAARRDIDVMHAESVTFSDGSLGCARPGQVYTLALVPGFRVVLGHHGQQFDYRATAKGHFMLCEQPSLTPPGTGFEPPAQ